jgi:hypothetical protein
MAIAGGALVAVHGWLADHYGLQQSFLLTAVCELYILFCAVGSGRPTPSPTRTRADTGRSSFENRGRCRRYRPSALDGGIFHP